MPEPAPVRRALAGQGISLARLMSVVVVVTVLIVIAGTRLHVAEVQRRRRKLGGRRFGGEKRQSPSAPSTPRLRPHDIFLHTKSRHSRDWRAGSCFPRKLARCSRNPRC